MVELAQDERDELEAVLKSSTRRAVSATKLQRARILLAVDQGGAGPALTDHAGGGCAGGNGADLPARASAGGGAGADGGSGAQASAVASSAEEVGRGEGSASGSGGLFGSTGRPRSVDREAAGGRAGAA